MGRLSFSMPERWGPGMPVFSLGSAGSVAIDTERGAGHHAGGEGCEPGRALDAFMIIPGCNEHSKPP